MSESLSWLLMPALQASVIMVMGLHLLTLRWRLPNYDEIVTIVAARESLARIPTVVALGEGGTPPLFHFLLHFAIRVSERMPWLRCLQLALGLAQLTFLYLIGRELFDLPVAWLAVLLYALSVTGSYEARQVRSYPLFIALTYCSLWLLVMFLKQQVPAPWYFACLVPLHVALIYTQYFGVYVIAFESLIVAATSVQAPGSLVTWTIAHGLVGAAFLPWLPCFRFQVEKLSAAFYLRRPTLQTVVDQLSVLLGGRYLLTCTSALIGMLVLEVIRRVLRDESGASDVAIVLTCVFVGVFLLFVLGYSLLRSPIFQSTYLSFLLPAIMLLLARALTEWPRLCVPLAAMIVALEARAYVREYFDRTAPSYDAILQAYHHVRSADQNAPITVLTDDVREYGVGIWLNDARLRVKLIRELPHYGWGLAAKQRGDVVLDATNLAGQTVFYIHTEPPGYVAPTIRARLRKTFFAAAVPIDRRTFQSAASVRRAAAPNVAIVDKLSIPGW